MERSLGLLAAFSASLLLIVCSHGHGALLQERKLYIVYLGARSSAFDSEVTSLQHHDMLTNLLGSAEEARNSMVYSYRESFSGFAATLSAQEAASLSKWPDVLSVFPSRTRRLHTTRSWEFLGVTPSSRTDLEVGSDVVIGIFDTGIWPELESFSDQFLSAVPGRWKGICLPPIKCNKKLVGARFYSKGYEREYGTIDGPKSARDNHGHGSHTASIAAGGPVQGASFFGLAEGIARGGYPGARVAAYKVCWGRECSDADVLAAFNDALSDGVDILSVSLGEEPIDYFQDAVAIGSFHAMEKGILTAVSAGNEGPALYVVKNSAPWLFTVAASTIDREFVSEVVLGNKVTYKGAGINAFGHVDKWHSLVSGASVANVSSSSSKSLSCSSESLNATEVKGRIVLCYPGDDRPDASVLFSRGAGLLYVLTNDFDMKEAFSFAVPASTVDYKVGNRILSYINSTSKPVAKILPTTVMRGRVEPTVAVFSSRGPNSVTPDILKPDVTAPGVDILAAWSPEGLISGLKEDLRSSNFNIISGTSMSCPHVSGAAAYLKSVYPEWSPAALKSALMTTATVLNKEEAYNRHGALAYGSGQINPVAALDPGLIYDITPRDYKLFLCNIGYNTSQIRLLVQGRNFHCPKQRLPVNTLNYPSITVANIPSSRLNVSIVRTVTYMGTSKSTYQASLSMPPNVEVTVVPSSLSFRRHRERKSFVVRLVSSGRIPKGKFLEGAWEWRDADHHTVRSPIVIWRKN